MRRSILFAVPLFALGAAACDGEKTAGFCKAVDDNRTAYAAAQKSGDAAIDKAVAEGRIRLAAAVKTGEIKAWRADVQSVGSDLAGLGVVKLRLPCGATLIAGDIAPDAALSKAISALAAGKPATFDGAFVASPAGSPYMEISLTGRGMMTDPEFLVRLAAIKQ